MSHKTTRLEAGVDRPLTLDELADIEDVPATRLMPKSVQSGLERADVVVTTMGDPVAVDDESGQLVLPAGSFVGLGASEPMELRPDSLVAPATPPAPYRPEWQPMPYFPRPSVIPVRTLVRKRGTRVVLTDSGRAYGEYPARQPFRPAGYPWQCIGRLFVWNDASQTNWSSYGSASLVGDRTILTAGHMVPWGSRNWKALFVAGYYDGASVAGSGGQSWITDAHGYNPNNSVVAHDMAVMRLADPIGSWLGFMGTKAYEDGWEGGAYWTLVGYPTAITPERPSFQSAIHVIDDDEDGDAQELEHHGDDTGGDSGGPFFGMWSDGPYAIGTVSGYEVISGGPFGIGDEDNNIAAGGPALNSIVAYGRTTWPK
jgi:V8-like Glu-specific endopeptidase